MMGAIFTNKKYAFPVSCTHLLDIHQSCVEPSYPILTLLYLQTLFNNAWQKNTLWKLYGQNTPSAKYFSIYWGKNTHLFFGGWYNEDIKFIGMYFQIVQSQTDKQTFWLLFVYIWHELFLQIFTLSPHDIRKTQHMCLLSW